jgi:hypothetical protein
LRRPRRTGRRVLRRVRPYSRRPKGQQRSQTTSDGDRQRRGMSRSACDGRTLRRDPEGTQETRCSPRPGDSANPTRGAVKERGTDRQVAARLSSRARGDYEVPLSDVGDAGSIRASRLVMFSFTSPYGRMWLQNRVVSPRLSAARWGHVSRQDRVVTATPGLTDPRQSPQKPLDHDGLGRWAMVTCEPLITHLEVQFAAELATTRKGLPWSLISWVPFLPPFL